MYRIYTIYLVYSLQLLLHPLLTIAPTPCLLFIHSRWLPSWLINRNNIKNNNNNSGNSLSLLLDPVRRDTILSYLCLVAPLGVSHDAQAAPLWLWLRVSARYVL